LRWEAIIETERNIQALEETKVLANYLIDTRFRMEEAISREIFGLILSWLSS
jgi:hypothetical protein